MTEMLPFRWNWARILFARIAPILLGIAAALTIWAFVLSHFDILPTTHIGQTLMGISGALAALGMFGLWIPMWFFWFRYDSSPRWQRTIWFFLLLSGAFGMIFATIPYYLIVYLPTYFRQRSGEIVITSSQPRQLAFGFFGKILIACWGLFFICAVAAFVFPKVISGTLGPVADYLVLPAVILLVSSVIFTISYVLRIGLRRD
jgi:hypothetical protein